MAEDEKIETEESSTSEETNEEETKNKEVEENEEEESQEETTSSENSKFNSLRNRNAELSQDRKNLQAVVNRLLTASPAIEKKEEEVSEDSEVTPAIFNKTRKEHSEQLRQATGVINTLLDRVDELSIIQSPVGLKYKENRTTVEQYRLDKYNAGQYVTREEALAIVLARQGISLSSSSTKKKVKKQKIKPSGDVQSADSSKPKTTASKKFADLTEEEQEERLKGLVY